MVFMKMENDITDFYLKLLELQSNDLIENKFNYLLKKYDYLKDNKKNCIINL